VVTELVPPLRQTFAEAAVIAVSVPSAIAAQESALGPESSRLRGFLGENQ
jgi:hypothetical protein